LTLTRHIEAAIEDALVLKLRSMVVAKEAGDDFCAKMVDELLQEFGADCTMGDTAWTSLRERLKAKVEVVVGTCTVGCIQQSGASTIVARKNQKRLSSALDWGVDTIQMTHSSCGTVVHHYRLVRGPR
jgi:hypothetical protein